MTSTHTMLHKGQTFQLSGRTFKVDYVNPSRAHCIAREPVTVSLHGRTFVAHKRTTIDISPNTCVEALRELSR